MKPGHENTITAEVMADMQAVSAEVAAGKPLDPEIARRVRERSIKAQEEWLRHYGVREIAVELIREIRDEE